MKNHLSFDFIHLKIDFTVPDMCSGNGIPCVNNLLELSTKLLFQEI